MGAIFEMQDKAVIAFDGDGEKTEFPFGFDVFETGDVTIRIDDVPVTAGFHVALFAPADAPGGIVRFETAPGVDSRVEIARRLKLRRLSDYAPTGNPRGDAINRDLDYVTAALGDIDRALTGNVRLAPADQQNGDAALPKSEPGRVLIWNMAGTGLVNGPDGAAIADAALHGQNAQSGAIRAEAAGMRAETALASFNAGLAGAAIDIDLRAGNMTVWQDERRMPVIDAPGDRILDARDSGALVRLSNGGRLTLPVAGAFRNGVRYRVVNGDGTMVDVVAANGNVIVPFDGVIGGTGGGTGGGVGETGIYALPLRGDCVDLVCDGVRWFALPIRAGGPVAKLLRNGVQDIPAGGFFLVEWDQLADDSHGLYDAENHAISGLPAGYYHIDAGVNFALSAAAVQADIYLERGGSGGVWNTHLQASEIILAGLGGVQTIRLNGVARLAGGIAENALRLRVRHGDSVTRQIAQSQIMTWLHLYRIGG